MSNEYQAVTALIDHRDPFLFVDKLVSVTQELIVGEYLLDENEWYFQGHFPHYPVVPGVLLIEMMAQCGGAGLRQLGILPGGVIFVLASIEKAKFRSQVKPKDLVTIKVKNLRVSKIMIRQSGQIFVGDVLAAEATWMCLLNSIDEKS